MSNLYVIFKHFFSSLMGNYVLRAIETVHRQTCSARPKWSFDRSVQFSANCNENTMPQTAHGLVNIAHGLVSTKLERLIIDMQEPAIPAAATIAQLIVFNSVQHILCTHCSRVSPVVKYEKKDKKP